MLSLLRDQLTTLSLRARYQRLIQERLLTLAESSRPVAEDPGDWQLVGSGKSPAMEATRTTVRDRARRAVRENPHAANILRLLTAYVTGPGLQLNHQPIILEEELPPGAEVLRSMADQIWQDFLDRNARHYSFREHARRTWRDGECFIRRFSSVDEPVTVRFVDPELVVAPPEAPESQGILTDPEDVEQPVGYCVLRSGASGRMDRIPADEMLQTRVGVDSNERRGISILAPILSGLDHYERWLETELLARKLQSSIVLWRKVQGGGQFGDSLGDRTGGGTGSGSGRDGGRERFGPGTILTTNHGTDMQFLQPNTNFGDAAPLGRMMLLGIAAGCGLPEFMLTADASNGNFSSTMVAEGPAVKFFQSEQQFFAGEFARIWHWVMEDALHRGWLPENFFSRMRVGWSFPSLISRDRSKERLADVRLVESGVLSRAEVARRDGVQPEVMRSERAREESATP